MKAPAHNAPLSEYQMATPTRDPIAEDLRNIRRPRTATIGGGTLLCRFASSEFPDRWWTSPWWFRVEDLQQIENARIQSLNVHKDPKRAMPLGYFAKQALAIRQQWVEGGPKSLTDMLIIVRLRRDVIVYMGEAARQEEKSPNGITIIYDGWKGLEQLYLPSIRNSPSDADSLFERVLQEKVLSFQFF